MGRYPDLDVEMEATDSSECSSSASSPCSDNEFQCLFQIFRTSSNVVLLKVTEIYQRSFRTFITSFFFVLEDNVF